MSGIEELRQRVVRAEEQFGLINAERAKYSERLMGLIDAIETRLGDQQAEIEQQARVAASQADEIETLRRDSTENKLLRDMLHSLLCAIEAGGSDTLGETMRIMDAKISALIAGTGVATPVETVVPGVVIPEAVAAGSDDVAALEADSPETDVAGAGGMERTGAEVSEAEDLDPAVSEAKMAAGADTGEVEEVAAKDSEAEVFEPVAQEAGNPDIAAAGTVAPDEDEPEAVTEEAAAPESVAAEPVSETEAPEAAAESIPAEELADPSERDALAGASEIMDLPVSDADVTMIDEEMVIRADGEEAGQTAEPLTAEVPEAAAGAAMANLVDEDDAVLDISGTPAGQEQKSEAASLEDIMRRVSKLVEEEGAMGPLAAGGVQIGAGEQSPEAGVSEPEAAQQSAAGA